MRLQEQKESDKKRHTFVGDSEREDVLLVRSDYNGSNMVRIRTEDNSPGRSSMEMALRSSR